MNELRVCVHLCKYLALYDLEVEVLSLCHYTQ